jgi:ABC-2 type transport system permease protein
MRKGQLMHPRAILAIARKDALDILMNKTTLVLLLTPFLIGAIFIFIANVAGAKTTDIYIADPGNSGIEQVIANSVQQAHLVHAPSAASVAAAFGADGTHKDTSYSIGLVVPADFDVSLRAGGHPQVRLYVNGSDLNQETQNLLVNTITNYARRVATPQDPVSVSSVMINPPSKNDLTKELTNFGALATLMSTFMVGISLLPGMMVEEKERKTLRMLLVSPASLLDIVVAKMLVGLGYVLALALCALALTGGFTGQVPLVLLFVALGALLALSLGLLVGCLSQTTSAMGAFSSLLGFAFLIPIFVLEPVGISSATNPIVQVIRVLPTYYLANGTYDAMRNVSAPAETALAIAMVAGSTLIFIAASVYILRRQSAVMATI